MDSRSSMASVATAPPSLPSFHHAASASLRYSCHSSAGDSQYCCPKCCLQNGYAQVLSCCLPKSCHAACTSPVMLLTELSCTSPVMLLAAHFQELWHVHQAMLQVVFSPSYLLALLAADFRQGKSYLICCVLALNKSQMFLQ